VPAGTDVGGRSGRPYGGSSTARADAALLCLRPLATLAGTERDALDQAARYLSLEVARQQAVQAGFAHGVLGPVRAHDRRRGGELERTLRAFLDHDGQWNATAAALFVHVNTLRNRLARITGRDVTRTADRVDLVLALEADAAG
jgi:DNA-binding PucR family transcriptional regulator